MGTSGPIDNDYRIPNQRTTVPSRDLIEEILHVLPLVLNERIHELHVMLLRK